jgi:hypothetical protein
VEREDYHSRYITGMQLQLVGESLIKWMAWDIMRGIACPSEKISTNGKSFYFGAVAEGGDPAAVVAALDQRVSAVVPFNSCESTPEVPRFIPKRTSGPWNSPTRDWVTGIDILFAPSHRSVFNNHLRNGRASKVRLLV